MDSGPKGIRRRHHQLEMVSTVILIVKENRLVEDSM